MTAKRRTPRAQSLAVRPREPAPLTMRSACVACETEISPCTRAEAFVGGMLFVLQHNKEAVLRQLCEYHKRFMVAGYVHTRDVVAEEEAMTTRLFSFNGAL